jgi:sugar-specific transcriptional regulator TrmB
VPVGEEEITALHLLGLTNNESKVYLTLIRSPGLTAGELSFTAQIPRVKAYGIIRELIRKGLIRVLHGSPDAYAPVSPHAKLKDHAERLNNQAASSLQIINSLEEEFSQRLNGQIKSELPRDANELWYIDGRKHIYNRVNQILGEATESISYCTSAAGLVRAYKATSDLLEKASNRGAVVRILTQVNDENRTVVEQFADVVELRPLSRRLGEFVSVDGRELIMMEISPDDYEVDDGVDRAVWTTNTLLIHQHERLFEEIFRTKPLGISVKPYISRLHRPRSTESIDSLSVGGLQHRPEKNDDHA